jgi:hypothetical protein
LANFSLFGFKIGKDKNEVLPSFSPPVLDDGAVTITASAHYGTSIDLESNFKNDVELITRYREMAMQPEIESAIDDIINESIIQDENKAVELILDDLKISHKVKKAIDDEFKNILILLNFKGLGQDIFRRFYVDGRLNYNIILDKDSPQSGIQELRYIDPRKLSKIREIIKSKDPVTGASIVSGYNDFYVYSDNVTTKSNTGQTGLKIAPDSIINVTSGLMDAKRSVVLSHLHKGIKPLNQLRMIEDASIIYKISRAPERRIFYIDVGNLPKMKAEQYIKDIMAKYKNKVVYNAQSGMVQDTRNYLSMQDDFWLPRRQGSGTEITTLPSSGAFDDMSMVEYFEKKLYKALTVPYSRLHQADTTFSIGRSQEITRDEVKFAKFITRLQSKFVDLFDQALRVQCILKGICTDQEFDEYKQNINYKFEKDNNYEELKEAELIQNRVSLLGIVDAYTGKYYSQKWIQKNVLCMSDDDITEIKAEMDQEIADGLYVDPKLIAAQETAAATVQDQPDAAAATTAPSPSQDQPAADTQDQQTQQPDNQQQNPYYNAKK